MKKFIYLVTVDADNRDQADIVMGERIGYEEQYYITPDGEPVGRDDARPEDKAFEYSLDFTFMEAMTERENPPEYYAMFSDEGNAEVAKLVRTITDCSGTSERARTLIEGRDDIAKRHPEVTDTAVREQIWGALDKTIGDDAATRMYWEYRSL